MKKKMTMKAYENTKQDKASDKKEAKKKGVSVSTWEKSKEDARMDKAAVKKMNKRK